MHHLNVPKAACRLSSIILQRPGFQIPITPQTHVFGPISKIMMAQDLGIIDKKTQK